MTKEVMLQYSQTLPGEEATKFNQLHTITTETTQNDVLINFKKEISKVDLKEDAGFKLDHAKNVAKAQTFSAFRKRLKSIAQRAFQDTVRQKDRLFSPANPRSQRNKIY